VLARTLIVNRTETGPIMLYRVHLLLAAATIAVAPALARTVIEGPYVGVLPCADCPGIRTELALERDAATGAPRRYWLRETYLDAGAGKRKREFVAKATPRDDEAAKAERKAEGAPDAVSDELPAAARVEEKKPDGTGIIESTLDARSVESLGAWSEEPGSASRSARIVIETTGGARYFARLSERAIEVLSRTGSRIASTQNTHLLLQAGGASALSAPPGVNAAGIVTRDTSGRLVLSLCGDRGALLLTDGARVPSVAAALDAVDFARTGRAYLEVYGARQGASLRVTRVARASIDLNCASAAPAPVVLSVTGGDSGWSLRADADGIRLSLPSNAKPGAQRGSVAAPLAWSWRDGRAEAASATLRSGEIVVRAVPRLCRDTMSNTVYGLAAEMNYGTQRLEGCAWSAAADQP
jgi:uncharacterized membrane protein